MTGKIRIVDAQQNPVFWKAIHAPYNKGFVQSLRGIDKGKGPDRWLIWDDTNEVWIFQDTPPRRELLLGLLKQHFPNLAIEMQ